MSKKSTLTADDFMELIRQEIAWCKENGWMVSKEEAEWFIAGLVQARRIIKEAQERYENE